MKISIDSKITRILQKPLKKSEQTQFSHCIDDVLRYISKNIDCLLDISPSCLKTQLLLAIADKSQCQKEMRLILPDHRSWLCSEYPLENIRIQSVDDYINDTNKVCGILFVDAGERIGDPQQGERLETVLMESDTETPLVLAMNSRSNMKSVIRWLSLIRNRKAQIVKIRHPIKLVPTFFTHTGEWLPLLDKKKLNRKIKNHLKTEKNKSISLRKIVLNCIDLLTTQKLLPALFIMPDKDTALKLWKQYPEKEITPGQFLTIPQIVTIIDHHPRLKDNPLVFQMLKKRAAICFNDLAWIQLVENFFFQGAFDVAFITPELLNKLNSIFKSLIIMGHPDHDTKTTNISLELWYDQLSMRLGNHISALDGSHHVFCIVTDAPQVSPVHVKDYFDPGTSELHSQFKWDIHSFLTRMIRKKPALNDLSRSFLVACQGNQNNVLFQDTIMEIQAEFPHAKCYPVTAMTALSNMRIRWTNELTETGKQVKSMPGLETKYKTIQFLLDCLPCNDCPHESTCQHRGSKRSRELVQTFHKFQSDERNRYLFLEITASYFHSLLISLDWINASDEILPKGQMASQLGPIATPLLVECLFNQIIPLKNQHLEKTILAGFLPNELSMPGHIDLRFPAVSACYQECWPHLKQAAYQMLRLGLQPQMPDYLLSCLYYSLTSDKDQRVSDQTHLTQTNVDYFIAMVDDLYSKAIS